MFFNEMPLNCVESSVATPCHECGKEDLETKNSIQRKKLKHEKSKIISICNWKEEENILDFFIGNIILP